MSTSRDELNEAQISICVSPPIKSVPKIDGSFSISEKKEFQSFIRQLDEVPKNSIKISIKKQKLVEPDLILKLSPEQSNITPIKANIQNQDKKIRMSHFKGLYLASLGRKNSQSECPICFNNFDQLLEQKKTLVEICPCSHIICKECVLEWVQKYKTNCPVCRQKIANLWGLIQTNENNTMKREENPLIIQQSSDQWDREQDDFYFEPDPNDQSENLCMQCQSSENIYLMLICDKCNSKVCHTYCDPALESPQVPEDKWYCLNCRKSTKQYNQLKRSLKIRNLSSSYGEQKKPILQTPFLARLQLEFQSRNSNLKYSLRSRREQNDEFERKWRRF